jgi:hypothetical protein
MMKIKEMYEWVWKCNAEQKMRSIKCGKEVRACGCVGPQNGEPLCPCRMQNVRIVNGRYVEQRDLGPVYNIGEEKD